MFHKLANSVEDFTTRLLDPMQSDQYQREGFGYFILDDILDDAIDLEQKKVCGVQCKIHQLNHTINVFLKIDSDGIWDDSGSILSNISGSPHIWSRFRDEDEETTQWPLSLTITELK